MGLPPTTQTELVLALLPRGVDCYSIANKVGLVTMMDSIIAGLGAAFSFAALQISNDYVLKGHGLTCLCPPLGAVAVLLFCLPGAPGV